MANGAGLSTELSGGAISAQVANGGYARMDCAGHGFDGAGKIAKVEISYPRDFVKQQLAYSAMYK